MSINPGFQVQEKIDAFDRRWRWLKFWEYLFTTAATFSLFWLGLEICIWREVITASWIFVLITALFCFSAVLAFIVIFAMVAGRAPKRKWLAAQLEKGCPGLLDRLNTLVFLEGMRRPYPFAIRRGIEAQAAQVMAQQPVVSPFTSGRAWERLGEFAFILAAAILFAHYYHPFNKLVTAKPGASMPKNDAPFELVPGNVNESRTTQKPWGEVRIVVPGHDVKLTKIDVLQLQIEMAASAPLQHPAWITSINGGPEERHELAAPTEPQYAVYQTLVYLDELKVSDWDVVSYYAKVETATPAEYASQIYFIDIRPFREDIEKETGGDGAKSKHARNLLNELNELITRQTSVLQQTHQYQQTSYATDEARKQDNKKLTTAESGLSHSADQFYGKIVAENENAPIGDILDHLTQAEQQMDQATENLGEDIIPEAKQREQGALTELVACRKAFFKVISQNPGAFGGEPADSGDNDPIATAQESLKAMSKVTEMHDRDQAALSNLHNLAQQQQRLAQQAAIQPPLTGAPSAGAESDLKNKVDKLMQDNPDLFRGADSEKASLESDMSEAINKLGANDSYQGRHYLSHAAGDMNDLEKVAQRNHQLQQMAEAYKLKKIIDQNTQQLGQETAKPGSLSPQDIQALSESAKRSTGTLKDIADAAGPKGFGPGMSQALSPENQQALQKALDQLGQAPPGPASQSAAGTAQGNLAKVSQAFQQGQTGSGQAGSGDQGQAPPAGDDALSQAMQQLQGLILAQQKPNPPSQSDQHKEMGEILGDLETSLGKMTTPAAVALLAQVKEMKMKQTSMPVNGTELKKLLDKVELMSAEANDPNKDKPPGAEITVIDADKLPPNYRARIRVYYEQLSNHAQ